MGDGGSGGGGTGGISECQSPEDCDDGNECTTNICIVVAAGRTVCDSTVVADGTACDEGSECTAGMCSGGACNSAPVEDGTACGDDAGTCQQGSCALGTTTWRANTTPVGSNGGPTATGGGCEVFVPGLNTNVYLDVTITLDASYDASAGELTTGYTVAVTFFLFPTLVYSVEYGNLSVETAITDGTPATVTNEADPDAIGRPIGEFMDGAILTFATPDEILSNTEAVTSTSPPIEVNFSGRFDLVLGGGSWLFEVDGSKCVFDQMGAAIEL